MNGLDANTKKGEEKMERLDFERKIHAPDEIHSGLMFNEYIPEGQTVSVKDVLLGILGALILAIAYGVVGYLEMLP